jgi:hypothetical protein
VLVLVLVGVLVALGLGALVLARGLVDRHQLATTTDLLALTAVRTPWGAADPCDAVRREAARRSIEATRCAFVDGVVVVEARARGPWGIPLIARARATVINAPS